MPYALTAHGRAPGDHPQDRRRGDPAPGRGRGRHAPHRRARRGRRRARRRRRAAQRGVEVPGRGRMRIVVAGAPPPSKIIERVETELGWEFIQIYGLTETSPLLTINRAAGGVRRPRRRRTRPPALAGRRARRRRPHAPWTPRARCSPAPTTCSRATGSSPRRRPRRSRAAGSTPATAAISTAPYVVISDRKKDVIITRRRERLAPSRSRTASTSTRPWPRWRSSASPTRSGARPSRPWSCCAPGAPRSTEADLIAFCRARLAALQVPDVDGVPRRARRARPPASSRSSSCASPYWEGRARRVN